PLVLLSVLVLAVVSAARPSCFWCFFFLGGTAPSETYTLSLHDALPIFGDVDRLDGVFRLNQNAAICAHGERGADGFCGLLDADGDRKSTRLNSSHVKNSYAVFCLKKKKRTTVRSEHSSRLPIAVTRERG